MATPNERGPEYWLGQAFDGMIRSGKGITTETPKHFKQLALRHVFAHLPTRSLPYGSAISAAQYETCKELAKSFYARHKSLLWTENEIESSCFASYFSALLDCTAEDELLAKVLGEEIEGGEMKKMDDLVGELRAGLREQGEERERMVKNCNMLMKNCDMLMKRCDKLEAEHEKECERLKKRCGELEAKATEIAVEMDGLFNRSEGLGDRLDGGGARGS